MHEVPLSQIDGFLVENENMRKQGKLGKLIAEHRRMFVVGATILMILGAFPILWVLYGIISIPFRTVAAGISYFNDPLQVTLPNGLVVHAVHQPQMAVTTVSQASMVMADVRAKRDEREMLTEESVKRGYLQWRVASGQPLHNFTLEAMKPVLKKDAESASGNTCPCLCYVNFGIAENIVYMVQSGEILYEPSVLSTSPSNYTEKIEPCKNKARSLVRETVALQSWFPILRSDQPAGRVPDSGVVHYVAHSGRLNQRHFRQPLLACIVECISYFE